MHLLIISNMEHYKEGETIWGWGPTVQEINNLATLFDKVTHVGCLHIGPPANSSLPYRASNLRFVGVPPTGGPTFFDKLSILRHAPLYIRKILSEISHADVVHVRCPANIPLLAIMLLAVIRRPRKRWVKYAGNWQPSLPEPMSYTFQRWWLRRNFCRSLVTVNGRWPQQHPHVISFFNPCLDDSELDEGVSEASRRRTDGPLRLLFVGALNEAKGILRVIQIMRKLHEDGENVLLDVVGDGPDREKFQRMADDLGLVNKVVFHGWIRRTNLSPFYAAAHCILLPSKTEGWPKVLGEAMAYGVVPIAAAVSSIPQHLSQFGTGRAITFDDVEGYISAVKEYDSNRDLWREESRQALQNAHLFSYGEYVIAVKDLLARTSQ